MSDPVETARQVVDAFNVDDWERSEALLAPDALYNEVGTGRKLRGAAEIIPALKGWKVGMPDVKGTVTEAFASGNKAVIEVTWEGTQTGPIEGPSGTIPASGKRQKTGSAWVFEVEDGKVKESRNYFDMLSLLTQIGAMGQ